MDKIEKKKDQNQKKSKTQKKIMRYIPYVVAFVAKAAYLRMNKVVVGNMVQLEPYYKEYSSQVEPHQVAYSRQHCSNF